MSKIGWYVAKWKEQLVTYIHCSMLPTTCRENFIFNSYSNTLPELNSFMKTTIFYVPHQYLRILNFLIYEISTILNKTRFSRRQKKKGFVSFFCFTLAFFQDSVSAELNKL